MSKYTPSPRGGSKLLLHGHGHKEELRKISICLLFCVGSAETAWEREASWAERKGKLRAVSNLWRKFVDLFGDKPKLKVLQIVWPGKRQTPISLFSWEVLIQLFSDGSSCPSSFCFVLEIDPATLYFRTVTSSEECLRNPWSNRGFVLNHLITVCSLSSYALTTSDKQINCEEGEKCLWSPDTALSSFTIFVLRMAKRPPSFPSLLTPTVITPSKVTLLGNVSLLLNHTSSSFHRVRTDEQRPPPVGQVICWQKNTTVTLVFIFQNFSCKWGTVMSADLLLSPAANQLSILLRQQLPCSAQRWAYEATW